MVKKPSFADINKRNKDFWADIQKQVGPLLNKPSLVADTIDDMNDEIKRWGSVKGVASLESALIKKAAKESARQRKNRQGKPVKNRKLTHRDVVIAAMRAGIARDMTCLQFLAAGKKDAWEGLEFEFLEESDSYKVSCGILEPRTETDPQKAKEAASKVVPYKTLESWYTVAKKS
ncbi:hypothetical protein LJR034_000824 [Caballeronia sp. LjRoot34]|uniref:hypothetical protein n=1 Tax=Caballeronia sp. LjRoot34 TaxID=3342325 RepID=UPI003ECF3A37